MWARQTQGDVGGAAFKKQANRVEKCGGIARNGDVKYQDGEIAHQTAKHQARKQRGFDPSSVANRAIHDGQSASHRSVGTVIDANAGRNAKAGAVNTPRPGRSPAQQHRQPCHEQQNCKAVCQLFVRCHPDPEADRYRADEPSRAAQFLADQPCSQRHTNAGKHCLARSQRHHAVAA